MGISTKPYRHYHVCHMPANHLARWGRMTARMPLEVLPQRVFPFVAVMHFVPVPLHYTLRRRSESILSLFSGSMAIISASVF